MEGTRNRGIDEDAALQPRYFRSVLGLLDFLQKLPLHALQDH